MGTGRAFSFHETDDTRAKSAEAAFEALVKRITSDGKVLTDEKIPLYDEIGTEESQIGYERIIEFELQDKNIEFKLVRKVQSHRITGAGRHKSLEPLNPPRTEVSLKEKHQAVVTGLLWI